MVHPDDKCNDCTFKPLSPLLSSLYHIQQLSFLSQFCSEVVSCWEEKGIRMQFLVFKISLRQDSSNSHTGPKDSYLH